MYLPEGFPVANRELILSIANHIDGWRYDGHEIDVCHIPREQNGQADRLANEAAAAALRNRSSNITHTGIAVSTNF